VANNKATKLALAVIGGRPSSRAHTFLIQASSFRKVRNVICISFTQTFSLIFYGFNLPVEKVGKHF
jgi:hypothetical protein